MNRLRASTLAFLLFAAPNLLGQDQALERLKSEAQRVRAITDRPGAAVQFEKELEEVSASFVSALRDWIESRLPVLTHPRA
jgi:hypothetical protein